MTILLLISVGMTFFMMGYVATTPHQNSKARLCFSMMLIGLLSLMIELAIFEEGASYLYIVSISGPLSVSVPIFFYLYFKASMGLNDEFQWRNAKHLLVPCVYLIVMMPYNLLGEAAKQHFFALVYTNEPIPWQLSLMPIRFSRLLLISGLGSVYLYLSWRELHVEMNKKKNDVLREINRLKVGFIGISISFAIVFGFFLFRLPHKFTWMISSIVIIITAISCMIFYYLPVLGKKIMTHQALDSIRSQAFDRTLDSAPTSHAVTDIAISVTAISVNKQYRSSVTSNQSEEVIRDLVHLMNEGVYKDSKLSLGKLAGQLQISTHHLSQIINQQTQGNYFDLINQYRIQDAKGLLLEGEMSVIDIAYEVGYNSKSSFYTEFKRRTQMTPHKFKQSHKH